jgi:hypothetical protein
MRSDTAKVMLMSMNTIDAGLGLLSKLKQLQNLSMRDCFKRCTHNGFVAALASIAAGAAPEAAA